MKFPHILLLLLMSMGLSAFTVEGNPSLTQPIRWPTPENLKVRISGKAKGSAGYAAILSALEQWGTIDDTALNLSVRDADEDIALEFVDTNWPAGLSGALGVTQRERIGDSYNFVRIRFNSEEFSIGSTGDPFDFDLESIAAHELGHALGLEHSQHSIATMYFAGRPGFTYFRTLDKDDRKGIQYIYPLASETCSADSDCPAIVSRDAQMTLYCNAQQRCSAGAAGFTSPCYENSDCTSGLCVFDPDLGTTRANVPNPGYCTVDCGLSDCPSPGNTLCADITGTALCYLHRSCIRDSTCAAEIGNSKGQCIQDLDGRFRCSLPCVDTADCAALSGTVCQKSDSLSSGWCEPDGGGVREDPCVTPLDCSSFLCAGTPPQCCDVTGCGAQDDGKVDTDGGPSTLNGGDSKPTNTTSGCGAVQVQGNRTLWPLLFMVVIIAQRRRFVRSIS